MSWVVENAFFFETMSLKELDNLLNDKYFDMNKLGGNPKRTLLHGLAMYNKSIKMIEVVLNAGAEVNIIDDYGCTPLHYAACGNDEGPELIRLLISKKADINIKNNNKHTPIHCAAMRNLNENVMKALVNAPEANVDMEDEKKCTPLHLAVIKNRVRNSYGVREVVKALLDAGADVKAKTKNGNTPLSFARRHKHNDEVIRVLEEALKKATTKR